MDKVYVVVESRWGSGDVGGSLLLETGEVLWGHMSSSLAWLRNDLTTSFTDRRIELERRFPDGYEVVVVDADDEIPTHVAAANEAWGATR